MYKTTELPFAALLYSPCWPFVPQNIAKRTRQLRKNKLTSILIVSSLFSEQRDVEIVNGDCIKIMRRKT